MAILFHDLGKAGGGQGHVERGVEIARTICRRIGMPEDDTERIAFLVEHHMLMTRISQHRDIDDSGIVESFAATMKTEERLRALFLLSYGDLSAVGPGVWNDWKGTLLTKLYLKTEKILLGRAEVLDEAYWKSPKAEEVRRLVGSELAGEVDSHLQGLGERYFVAFSPRQIAHHLGCVAEARENRLALRCTTQEQTGMSEIVVCTGDRQGLFSKIAGSFTSELIDINSAALFTRPDGIVVDCFTVRDAPRGKPLTAEQFEAVSTVLRAVLLGDEDVQRYVDRSRRRLFALLQPRVAATTRITFDNESSRTHTVIDVETGDRTGLLYDITRAMADAGLDIAAARIVTDVRRVRDSFYVTLHGHKLEHTETTAEIRDVIYNAIHPRTLAETIGEHS
jgi:[protein-PII] uridylyltransferase